MSKEVINLRKGLQGKHTDLFSSQLCICSFIHIRFGRRTWFQRGCSQTDIRPVISLRHSGHTKLQRRRRRAPAGRSGGTAAGEQVSVFPGETTCMSTEPEMSCYCTRQSVSRCFCLGWWTRAYCVKNAHHRVPKSEVTYLIYFLHPTNSPNLKDSPFTEMKDEEMQQILKIKRLEPANDQHFCWWSNRSNVLIFTMVFFWMSCWLTS